MSLDTMVKVSYSDIVPSDYQEELIQIGANTTEMSFRIGDIANMIYQYSQQSQQIVYSATGFFCGKSGNTVKYYAAIAACFIPAIREKYSVLSFSHFSFAKQMGVRWEEVLEYAISGEYSPLSVDNVMAHFTENKATEGIMQKAAEGILEQQIGNSTTWDDNIEEANIDLSTVTRLILIVIGQIRSYASILSEDNRYKADKALELLTEAFS